MPGLGSRPVTQLACPRAAWEVVSNVERVYLSVYLSKLAVLR